MTLFLLKKSQTESCLTQNRVKRRKKVSKSEIMNQSMLKKWKNESKYEIMTLLCDKKR